MAFTLGICSWSVRGVTIDGLAPSAAPALRDGRSDGSARALAACANAVGIGAVQLALDPLRRGEWPIDDSIRALAASAVDIRSGMMAMAGEDYSTFESIRETGGVRRDEFWPENLAAAHDNAALAARLGLPLVTFHAGFIPHDRRDPLRAVMIVRLREAIDAFATRGVRVALETGQETAETLLGALDDLDRPRVGVNFDPANMILYGMGDPVAALRRLAPRVAQIHVKDALPTAAPGTWGREVRVGEGAVDWPAFFEVARGAGLTCDLMIEREAGASRLEDMRAARVLVERLI